MTNLAGLRQGYMLRERGKVMGDVFAAKGGQEASECYVKRYFGGGKGEAFEIRQAWRGQIRQGISGVED